MNQLAVKLGDFTFSGLVFHLRITQKDTPRLGARYLIQSVQEFVSQVIVFSRYYISYLYQFITRKSAYKCSKRHINEGIAGGKIGVKSKSDLASSLRSVFAALFSLSTLSIQIQRNNCTTFSARSGGASG